METNAQENFTVDHFGWKIELIDLGSRLRFIVGE